MWVHSVCVRVCVCVCKFDLTGISDSFSIFAAIFGVLDLSSVVI